MLVFGADKGRIPGAVDTGHGWCETREDQVNHLSNGEAAGYAATISLDGEEMLTLTGSPHGATGDWNGIIAKTDFVIIPWRLES